MRFFKAILPAVAVVSVGLGFSSASLASTLDSAQGGVLVNRGGGYVREATGAQLKPGDLVMVRPGGNAIVSYSGGCFVSVQVGSVYVVQPENYCQLAATDVDITPYVVGAGVIGGGIAAGVLLSEGRSKPASP